MIKIDRNKIFKLANKKVILTNDVCITENDKGYFILNFWEQCEYEDVDIFPVAFIKCESEEELYILKKNNIIMGSEKEICLI